jgi:hypothetical protein
MVYSPDNFGNQGLTLGTDSRSAALARGVSRVGQGRMSSSTASNRAA